MPYRIADDEHARAEAAELRAFCTDLTRSVRLGIGMRAAAIVVALGAIVAASSLTVRPTRVAERPVVKQCSLVCYSGPVRCATICR